MDKKLFLIANPKSGRARLKNELLKIVSILTEGGYSVTVHPTLSRGDATRVAAELPEEFETVVCCGGDGTLNEVITGILQSGKARRLGYIPLGTLNEWSGGLQISRNIASAAHDILNGETMALDIGKFGDKYFAYTASFGAFTAASYSAPQDVKNVLGQAAYVFEAMKELSSIKPYRLKLDIDGKILEDDFVFGAISNSLSMGGVIKLAPQNVAFDDGLFEIVLIKSPKSLPQLQTIIDGILKKELNNEQIYMTKAHKIEIYGSDDINWTLDGEMCPGAAHISVDNLNRAINFIIPQKTVVNDR